MNCGLSLVANPKSPRTSVVDLPSNPFAVNLANSSSATSALSIFTAFVFAIPNVSAACPPISLSTSSLSLLSNPFAEERAYSSSATLALSILTAFVLAIPNVSATCPPMSLSTSLAPGPSIAVPSTRGKSLSTTPLVNVATLPLLIPALGMSLVSATVPADCGKVIVTSAVLDGPINVTALVPLSVSSLNKILPGVTLLPVNRCC